ncbi:Glycine cleavage system H protein (modular protein) [Kyrpidia spormannii]|uniref:Glycine cleavage system H protein (Modular protein) n=1 Tax=Kyrpidia spormannii TaxID=2055160 RepID=A0ACA8ZBC2_9BACL|nr:Glycine cleavage system H protein (modular protein) [Kyrpidia spormannii]
MELSMNKGMTKKRVTVVQLKTKRDGFNNQRRWELPHPDDPQAWPDQDTPTTDLHQQMWMGKPTTSTPMSSCLIGMDKRAGSGSSPALLQQFRTYWKFNEGELLLLSYEGWIKEPALEVLQRCSSSSGPTGNSTKESFYYYHTRRGKEMAVEQPQQWRVPEDRRYDDRHQWYLLIGSTVTVGITDYTQDTAGDILYLSVPRVGARIQAGEPMGSVESGKWVGQIYAPFDGVVVDANPRVEEDPQLLNRDPYGAGWICKIRPNRSEDVHRLLSPREYQALLVSLAAGSAH